METKSKFGNQLKCGETSLNYFDLKKLPSEAVLRLPYSIRVILEATLRKLDDKVVKQAHIDSILEWGKAEVSHEIPFFPARVLLQDFTGVPCIVDLAAMREAVAKVKPEDLDKINPLVPVELVVDHSIQVDKFGTQDARAHNETLEFQRNFERFKLLKWAQKNFDNVKIVPPGTGIVHQVNLEYLARVVFEKDGVLYPDSVVGTDSHTTMINGLGVLGWGVGGIEAEAVMLGQPVSMLLPKVVGVELKGKLPPRACATDLVLTLTNMLRKHGVVDKFVEFCGEGLRSLSLEDRATVANMSPEYGATMGYFPPDQRTLDYLVRTGRDSNAVSKIRDYLSANLLFREDYSDYSSSGETSKIAFSSFLTLDLATVEPSAAGPKRPQDRVALAELGKRFDESITAAVGFQGFGAPIETAKSKFTAEGASGLELSHGAVAIAAITSCTNTSNPFVLFAAGLLARKAVEAGLRVPKYVKTSLSPGSQVVTKYLANSGLTPALDTLGFSVAGYGCMTCIGNSGDLVPEAAAIAEANKDLVLASVLSGNRNFEGRVHPLAKANYLMAPVYVVAYALAGRVNIDFEKEELAPGVKLADIFPTAEEVQALVDKFVTAEIFRETYENQTESEHWKSIQLDAGQKLFQFDQDSTYIRNPPFFQDFGLENEKPLKELHDLACVLYFGDSITTDHISPAGNIASTSPAAALLSSKGVTKADFNSYGTRRGNHEVMMRGTFANVRIKNKLCKGFEGPFTLTDKAVFDSKDKLERGDLKDIFTVCEEAGFDNLVVLAGKEYGSGSSRDWAAKGPRLLGVRAVIAESFERIHRSNLIGMGVLPLVFINGETPEKLGLSGFEKFTIDLSNLGVKTNLTVTTSDGKKFEAMTRIDTEVELEYFNNGGILRYVLRNLLKK